MSLVSGMLAVQIMGSCLTMPWVRGGVVVHTFSSRSCVTVSHTYHDEGRGKARDIYCKYKGKILHPGESYEKSKFEICKCSEDGLECCKSKRSTRHGPHEFDHGPHELHHDLHDMSHGPHVIHHGPHGFHHDLHDMSHGPHEFHNGPHGFHHDLHEFHHYPHDFHHDLHPFDHLHFK